MSINVKAGYPTQIRKLRKRIKQLEMDDVDPQDIKAAVDSLRELESLYKEEMDRREERRKAREEKLKQQELEKKSEEPADGVTEFSLKDIYNEVLKDTSDERQAIEQALSLFTGGVFDAMEGSKREEFIEMALEKVKSEVKTEPTPEEDPLEKESDELPGGLADEKKDEDFDKTQLAKGVKVELEHTDDLDLAKEIARDHLVEDPKYYDKLEEVHKESEVSKFALDDVVEPTRGTPGSWGQVMRYEPEADLVYVSWQGGKLAEDHGFGAYKGCDLKKRSELTHSDTCDRCKSLYPGICDTCKKNKEVGTYRKDASESLETERCQVCKDVMSPEEFQVCQECKEKAKKEPIAASDKKASYTTKEGYEVRYWVTDDDGLAVSIDVGPEDVTKPNYVMWYDAVGQHSEGLPGDQLQDRKEISYEEAKEHPQWTMIHPDYRDIVEEPKQEKLFPGEKEQREEREKRFQEKKKKILPQSELDKDAASNIAVIESFINQDNPKVTSGNLYILPKEDGWELVNYKTVIAKHRGDKIALDNRKYSVTTSGIQTQIYSVAVNNGLDVVDINTGEPIDRTKKREKPEKPEFEKLYPGQPYERLSSLDTEAKSHGWEVYLNNKHIDTVFYDDSYESAEEVKKSLVDHDHYNPNIKVYREKSAFKKAEDSGKPGMGYGGNRPGTWVSPKKDRDVSLESQEEIELDVFNKKWTAKYAPNADGWAIFDDQGQQVLVIKDKKGEGVTKPQLEQFLFNYFGKEDLVRATLTKDLAVLKKGSKVKIVAVDAKRREAKFVSLNKKSVSGWTSVDKFNFQLKKAVRYHEYINKLRSAFQAGKAMAKEAERLGTNDSGIAFQAIYEEAQKVVDTNDEEISDALRDMADFLTLWPLDKNATFAVWKSSWIEQMEYNEVVEDAQSRKRSKRSQRLPKKAKKAYLEPGSKVVVAPTPPESAKEYPAANWLKDTMEVELMDYAPNQNTLDVIDVKLPDGTEESIYDFNIKEPEAKFEEEDVEASKKKADEETEEVEEPDSSDIIIGDDSGKTVARSPDEPEVIAELEDDNWEKFYDDILDWMERHKLYPSVFILSDHGNYHLDTDFADYALKKRKGLFGLESKLEGSKIHKGSVKIKSWKLLVDLARKCPKCFEKFAKFTEGKKLKIKADDIEETITNIREKIQQTKERLSESIQAEASSDHGFQKGDRVTHPEKGEGTVTYVSPEQITVDWDWIGDQILGPQPIPKSKKTLLKDIKKLEATSSKDVQVKELGGTRTGVTISDIDEKGWVKVQWEDGDITEEDFYDSLEKVSSEKQAQDPNNPPTDDPGPGYKWFWNEKNKAWERMQDVGVGGTTY